MTLDRVKYHVEDAGSEERAARHIALFLAWSARQGFLADDHEPSVVLADPVRYVLDHCPSLAEADFNEAGLRFIRDDQYTEFLEYLEANAEEAGVRGYDFVASEEGWRYLWKCLDEALAEFRE